MQQRLPSCQKGLQRRARGALDQHLRALNARHALHRERQRRVQRALRQAGQAGAAGSVSSGLQPRLCRGLGAGFGAQQLRERASAQMPPFSFQALLRAEARTQATAQAWLQAAQAAAQAAGLPGLAQLTLYPPLPLTVQRVAGVERAQMLLESPSRPALQAFLAAWQPLLHALRRQPAGRGLLRWAIDVDPVSL